MSELHNNLIVLRIQKIKVFDLLNIKYHLLYHHNQINNNSLFYRNQYFYLKIKSILKNSHYLKIINNKLSFPINLKI